MEMFSSPPPGRTPKQERSQITRERLLAAAIEILIEDGYAKLATGRVSERAGITRGAQQHHFPHKASLVVAAVHALAERQIEDIIRRSDPGGDRHERARHALQLLWDSYSGPLFVAWIEIVVAARSDAELRPHVEALEQALDHAINQMLAQAFGTDSSPGADFDKQVQTALATIRGLALLLMVGHDAQAVQAQWALAREHFATQLASPTVEIPEVRAT